MVQLTVIADDLTGACETGAQFAAAGLEAVVSVHADGPLDAPPDDAGVWVVDTESRHLAPDRAVRCVAAAVERGRQLGAGWFYKKVDSTLRGNVGAELEALMRASRARVLPFIPAYPAAGRTTRGGVQYVEGKPLDRTFFADDPLSPVESSSIPRLIARQSSLSVLVVTADRLPDAGGSEPCIWAFDAATEEDLDGIADALEECDLLRCCAGAAGFAGRIAARLARGGRRVAAVHRRGPVLLVNGSLHERSLAQVRHAPKGTVESRRLGPGALFAGDGCPGDARNVVESASAALRGGRDVLLYTIVEGKERAVYERCAAEHGAEEPPRAVAGALGALTAAVVGAVDGLGAVAVFGGETAVAVLRALGCGSVRPRRQLWPGVIECILSPPRRRLGFITKCGGFGPDDLVERLCRIYSGEGS